jgi:acetyltransferase-like isoleucine patch superfamily enzyme
MKTARLHLARVVFRVLPETRCFGLKAWLLRWCGAQVGRNVRVCSSVTILGGGDLSFGDDVWVGHGTFIFSGSAIRIGSCVDIGPQVYIGTGTHELDLSGSHAAGPVKQADVEIGAGVWLCARAVVLPGVTIGTKAVVAAGAVVTQDVPDRCLVGGVPARVLKTLS